MNRLPELPIDPEGWAGSDEWAERADARRNWLDERRLYEVEELFDEPLV